MLAGLLTLAALDVLLWIGLSLCRRRSWPSELFLPASPSPSTEPVVAIVPARDEQHVIGQSVESLLRQSHDHLRILVVDDGSGDDTAGVVRRLGRDPQKHELVLLANSERPEGWSGKVHALATGVAEAERRWPEARWWLFTDADIAHHPSSVRALLDVAAGEQRDLVSVMARLSAQSRWEKLIVPPFVWFFQLLYPFRAVTDDASKVAAAAGGCALVRRATLERTGGLAEIRDALIDDVALGRLIKRGGGGLWLGFDSDIVSIRPYPRLASLWRMVSRSAFDQLHYSWTLLVLVLLGLAIAFVAPPVLLGAGLLLATIGPPQAALGVAAGGLLAWLLQFRALLPAVRHHRVTALWAWTLPPAAALYGAMTLSSALSHLSGRSSTWKGRTYRRKRRRADP